MVDLDRAVSTFRLTKTTVADIVASTGLDGVVVSDLNGVRIHRLQALATHC